jgi:hypothetical protein
VDQIGNTEVASAQCSISPRIERALPPERVFHPESEVLLDGGEIMREHFRLRDRPLQ